jgi:hypothetical protein
MILIINIRFNFSKSIGSKFKMTYTNKTKDELIKICKECKIKGVSRKNKKDIISAIEEYNALYSERKKTVKEEPVKEEPVKEEPVKEEPVKEVLEHCQLPISLNINEMKNHISSYMASRISYYKKKNRAPFIEDEFSEFFTANATGGIEIGSGNYGMDVITQNNEGIDVMCVVMNKNISNEKSLIQNFISSGGNLDTLFNEKKDKEALDLFVNQYIKKLESIKNEKQLKELYVLSFISTMKDIYLTCFKINIDNVKNIVSGGFVKGQNDLCKNIIVNNFINPLYGNVKLYKSKKRMELRLCQDILKSQYTIKLYTMP